MTRFCYQSAKDISLQYKPSKCYVPCHVANIHIMPVRFLKLKNKQTEKVCSIYNYHFNAILLHAVSILMLITSPTHKKATELQHTIYLQKRSIWKYIFIVQQFSKFLPIELAEMNNILQCSGKTLLIHPMIDYSEKRQTKNYLHPFR